MLQSSLRFELLILDCDGVVVDSEPITMRVLVEMLHELGVAIGPEEADERFIGTTFARTLELIAELLGGPIPEDFVGTYRERTFAALEAGLKPVPGIEAALDRIAIPYCIASNGPRAKMHKTLGVTSLLPRFEGRMFSSADVLRGKPYPDLFLHAARHFGVSPAACLVVEDSTNGIAAARAAGMTAYGFSASAPEGRLRAAGAHRVFCRMSELPSLVSGIQ
ncbi:MAG TPA: HAD family hydrolase [Woeseiaceae bacterium]|nr:HAD family hydrolase [Woeseiaceae bacterium]